MKQETIFVQVFGASPIIRILDFLISYQAFDYPRTEIAEKAGVSYSTLQSFWNKLVDNKIVIKTRRVGKSDLYKLNTKNPAVHQLIKLDWNLIHGADESNEMLGSLAGTHQKESILATD